MAEAPTPPEALLNAALHLLGPRRRGVEELRGRLRKKGFSAPEVANCLAWLQERDLLDDLAFSEALARDRVKLSPRSPSALVRELVLKGISRSVAEEAVDRAMVEEGASETGLAVAAGKSWVRKQGRRVWDALLLEKISLDRERARRRLYAFLSRRGFRGEAAKMGMEAGISEARKLALERD